MRKMIALIVSLAFVLGTIGYAVAQTSAPAPAAAPTTEKKADDKSTEKKPAAKKSMTMEEKKAACLEKAGADDAKKANCEKRFAAKADKKAATATEKKEDRDDVLDAWGATWPVAPQQLPYPTCASELVSSCRPASSGNAHGWR